MKRHLVVTVALILIVIAGAIIFSNRQAAAPASNGSPAKTTPKSNSQPAGSTFDKSQHSLTDPTSIWVVVNKQRPLQPKTYAPADLVVPDITLRSNITSDERQVRQLNATALKTMADAAKQAGLTLTLESGYRSYDFQVNLYNRYVSQQGQSVADTQSARPGYSEHQTGLAADLGGTSKPSCNVEQCFADTPEGKWLALNAYKYGYIIRYISDKTAVTGYEYEPWHIRFIGTALSTEMHNKGVATLEEFFGLPPAPDYK